MIGLTVNLNNVSIMIFDFFFLKFYNGILKSSIPETPRFGASFFFGLFINVNILLLNMLLSKLNILPYVYNKMVTTICLFIIVSILFLIYKKSRIEAIKLNFSEENFKSKKKKWNVIFTLYVVFTILAVFILPFYKPGYLP